MSSILAVLGPFLTDIGAGVAATAIYDAIKSCTSSNADPTRSELEKAIQDAIIAHGLTVQASTVVDFMADQGIIRIIDSKIYAPEQISLAAQHVGEAFFGGTGVSATKKTVISSQGGGVRAVGNAAVVQNPDGSISFKTGPAGKIGIGVNPSDPENHVSFGTKDSNKKE